jgi:hypothetical protein
MWGGLSSNIPTGWVLCDGLNGTPDLRDKFIKGVAAGQNPGGTGGAATHSHSFTQPSDHAALTHSGTAIGNHTIGSIAATATAAVKIGTSGTTAAAQTHTHAAPNIDAHSVTQPSQHAAQSHAGGAVANGSNEPAYYTLCFIQKV